MPRHPYCVQAALLQPNQVCHVAGVDEAGRGPLAGPVYAAAVILDPARLIDGLADSKVLSAPRREQLAAEIQSKAWSWAIAQASVAEIDCYNILQATYLAMQRAVAALDRRPDEVWVDGNRGPTFACVARTIVRGDATVASIAAASILAKTARDACLVTLDHRYPEYGFAQHKGYPTPGHLAALHEYGPTSEHRASFAPVRVALARFSGL